MKIRVPALRAFMAFTLAATTATHAQEGLAGELKSLRQVVEQQAKQLDALAAQVARLNARLDVKPDAAGSAEQPAGTGNATGEFAIPAAKVVTPAAQANVHIVVKGESLEKIAKANGTTVLELQKLNKISDPKKLQIGQQLLLPLPPPKKEGQ